MDKLSFKARTLDANIVRDGLCAVSTLENSADSRQMTFLVGGIATQSYIPSSCRRPTADIDLAVLRPLTYQEFKDFSREACTYLSDSGYRIELKKGHNSYNLSFYDPSTKDASVIEFARRNNQNFGRIKDRLFREFKNSRVKIVEERGSTCHVSSPEDVVVPKVVRGIGTLKRNPSFIDLLSGCSPYPLTSDSISRNLSRIKKLRDQAVIHIGDPEQSEKLRLESDIYDIKLLHEVVGFNGDYLRTSMSDWSMIEDRSRENMLLVNYLFPNFKVD